MKVKRKITSKALMYKHRIEKILVLDDSDKLVGLITMKDIEKSIDYPLASRDFEGRLIVGAAVGVSKACSNEPSCWLKLESTLCA